MINDERLNGFKALFILPPFEKEHKITPPVGIGYLAAMLEKNRAECFFLDAIRDRMKPDRIIELAKKINPDIIGLTVLTPIYKNAKNLVVELKKNGFRVVLGGPHASALPKETLEDTGADFLIFGEGELTIVDLCNYLNLEKKAKNRLAHKKSQRIQKVQLEKIRGLAFKKGGKAVVNPPRELISNIDEIPFPSWHLFPPKKYPFAPQGTLAKNYPIANVLTSRGCPYGCTFCSTNTIWKRIFRARSAKNIVDEIEMLVKDFGIKEIHFIDDNLTMQRQRVIDVCDELNRRNIKISWACPNGVRIDRVDRELLRLMKNSGCYSLTFGIESGNQEILNGINKNIRLEQVEEVVKMAKEEGIEARGFFIIGLPGDNEKTIRQTIDFSKKLPLDFAGFSILVLMPGAELFNQWVQKNKIDVSKIDWNKFDSYNAKISICEVSEKRLKQLCSIANREFYIRPRILFGFLKYIKQTKWILKRLLHYR